jgi:hypothetical protein
VLAALKFLAAKWKALRTTVLTVAAFTCFSIAGFSVVFWLGMVVTGVCLLLLEWLSDGE